VTTNDDGRAVNGRLKRSVAPIVAAAALTVAVGGFEAVRAEQTNARSQVTVDNFSFAPATTSVPIGTTITWTNRDDVPHTIVSTEQKFRSPVLDTDEQFSHRFDVPGTCNYFCSMHPTMTGRIVVGG